LEPIADYSKPLNLIENANAL